MTKAEFLALSNAPDEEKMRRHGAAVWRLIRRRDFGRPLPVREFEQLVIDLEMTWCALRSSQPATTLSLVGDPSIPPRPDEPGGCATGYMADAVAPPDVSNRTTLGWCSSPEPCQCIGLPTDTRAKCPLWTPGVWR